MELIDRYVAAVGRRLPKKQRKDVEQELRSTLTDALDARLESESAGSAEEEALALLREHGAPEEVADSYRPGGQYLIGPELFPVFKKLTWVAVCAVAVPGFFVYLSVSLLLGGLGDASLVGPFFSLLGRTVDMIVWTVGLFVLIFAGLERLGGRPDLDPERPFLLRDLNKTLAQAVRWDPRRLPPISSSTDTVSRGEAAVEVVVPAFFLVLVNSAWPTLEGAAGAIGERVAQQVVLPNLLLINLAFLLGMAISTVHFIRGRRTWASRLTEIAIDLFGVWVFYLVAADLAAARGALVAVGLPERAADSVIWSGYAAVAVVAVIVLGSAIWGCYKALRADRKAPPWNGAAAPSAL